MSVLIRAEGELRCRHAPAGNGGGYLITTRRRMRPVPESGLNRHFRETYNWFHPSDELLLGEDGTTAHTD